MTRQVISLKNLLFEDFGVELPISGGTGNSIDNAIIMHRQVPNDFVSTEYYIVKCISIGRRVKWKLLRQELIEADGKYYDKLEIEVVDEKDDEIVTTIENYYFDITECYHET
jgi:hypothetical protein